VAEMRVINRSLDHLCWAPKGEGKHLRPRYHSLEHRDLDHLCDNQGDPDIHPGGIDLPDKPEQCEGNHDLSALMSDQLV
jgi:hypothetical protein